MSFRHFIEKSLLIILLLYSPWLLAKSSRSVTAQKTVVKETPPPIDLYTPGLRQPGGLIAFGENILPQGQAKLSFFADSYSGPALHYVDLDSSLLYGITDNLSLDLVVPYAAYYEYGGQHSSGLEDITLQLEYAYYTNSTSRYQEQATIVVNTSAPTGSDSKQPRTGAGSPTYFLGATYNRTYVDWLFFLSPGAYFTTTHSGTKYGDEYLYQLGVGRNIKEIGKNWIIAWVLELDGLYSTKTKVNGVSSPNTGGNVIYATPSLSLTGKKLSAQLGFGLPLVEDLNGQQIKTNYLLAANLGWVF